MNTMYENCELYLEISARQTGKTTRLVSAVVSHAVFSGDCVVVAHNAQTGRMLKEMIEPELILQEHRNRVTYVSAGSLSRWKKNVDHSDITFENLRVFYDEFDWFKSDSYFFFDSSGYYTTTPFRLRTADDIVEYKKELKFDPMLKLLDHTGGRYVAYSIYPTVLRTPLEQIKEWDNVLSDESFAKERGNALFTKCE